MASRAPSGSPGQARGSGVALGRAGGGCGRGTGRLGLSPVATGEGRAGAVSPRPGITGVGARRGPAGEGRSGRGRCRGRASAERGGGAAHRPIVQPAQRILSDEGALADEGCLGKALGKEVFVDKALADRSVAGGSLVDKTVANKAVAAGVLKQVPRVQGPRGQGRREQGRRGRELGRQDRREQDRALKQVPRVQIPLAGRSSRRRPSRRARSCARRLLRTPALAHASDGQVRQRKRALARRDPPVGPPTPARATRAPEKVRPYRRMRQ
ncbi:hypothetical protein J2S76_004396 [Ancylobacter vacuolatus]|uniref:Uncharacterized protein n=1 Tax=Ancylobacter vacuolatus TaxID=223389 RepID=A0ABU0DNB2_9HYPH|nr:hypothetical protein [Ancylobacter vacuolatus]